MRARRAFLLAVTVALVAGVTFPASAIHWYRGPGSGCTPNDGALTDDPAGTTQNVTAVVALGHNAFERGVGGTGFAFGGVKTTIKVGESVRWEWNSSHCHSVSSRGGLFNSGFHYPTQAPESSRVVPGFFEYPILDDTPTLTYTRTFTTPGVFPYFCVHHDSIGMNGSIEVLP